MPAELVRLRHVALSGDGEPTLCPNFHEAVQGVLHVRALGDLPFFKVVLVSNATGLDRPEVQRGLHALTPQDEVWLKLDGGTRDYLDRVNRPQVPLDKVLANILHLGRQRPVVIQSLFPRLGDSEPADEEIQAYVARLRELKEAGAQISWSRSTPPCVPRCCRNAGIFPEGPVPHRPRPRGHRVARRGVLSRSSIRIDKRVPSRLWRPTCSGVLLRSSWPRCGWTASPPSPCPGSRSPAVVARRWRRPGSPRRRIHFDRATATGVTFTNVVNQTATSPTRSTNGAGVATGDVDGDGWCDLYFCGIDRPNVLYRNLGH
jgi:hypothetical protein